MKKLSLVLVAFLILGVGGCAQKADIKAESAALRTADQEWSKAAAAKNVEMFTTAVSENGSIFPPNEPSVTGREAIHRWASTMMANPGFAISWQPTTVEVSSSADLGYTAGTYELKMNDPAGNPVTDRGKYVTVWKKQPDGKWKAAHDIFNSDIPLPTIAPPQP